MEQLIHVTKTVYTVNDFVDWQQGAGLNLRPYFQRGSVWQPKAKSFLIDTLVRGFPIPIIYVQVQTDPKTRKSVRRVVDGQQRLRTILAYVNIELLDDATDRDNFSIMKSHNPELAGRSFAELPPELRDRITNTELSVHVLPESVTDRTLLQIFARLNSTGEKLNEQELRNANFHGELKTLAYNLSYDQIDRWTEWSTFNTQALAQMKEVEFLSDVILMLLTGPAGRTKAGLDALYAQNDDEFPEASTIASIVPKLFEDVDHLASNLALKQFMKPSWLYTVFTVLALSRHGAPLRPTAAPLPSWIITNLPASLARIEELLIFAAEKLAREDIEPNLAKALRGASTDSGSRSERLRFLLSAEG